MVLMTYKVSLTDGTYANPTSGGGYENVNVPTGAVTTTITDEKKPFDPNNPTDPDAQDAVYEKKPFDPTNPTDPDAQDAVYAKISVDKTTVAEGGDIVYTVSLVDKDGNAVTVPAGQKVKVSMTWGGI